MLGWAVLVTYIRARGTACVSGCDSYPVSMPQQCSSGWLACELCICGSTVGNNSPQMASLGGHHASMVLAEADSWHLQLTNSTYVW